MDLEACFQDMHDMGATGVEILANAYIPMYPDLDDRWVDHWFELLDKYDIVPAEYGHWIDARLYSGRYLTTEESYEMLARDMRIANRLGFKVLRTKMGVIDEMNTPVENWREIIRMALPLAEELDVRMCPELHQPAALKSSYVDNYVEFIEKENTKYFGFNIDFGTFQDKFESDFRVPGMPADGGPASLPEDIIPILKYVYCCHAKFVHMDEDFDDKFIPYKKILTMAVAILMICGGADLSVGNQIARGSIVGAIMMETYRLPVWLAIVGMMLVCMVCSVFNMYMTQTLKGSTMIITLATSTIFSGLAYTISGANNFHNLPDSFMFIGQGKIFGSIPLNVVIMAVLFVIITIILSKTYFGKKIYASGDNAEAARLAGVNVKKTQLQAFAVAGVLTGICCVMLTARSGNATATTGNGVEFTGITACVLGGIPLKGGDGKLWKVIVAAYILGILANGMQLIGLSAYMQYIAKGAVMLLSIGMGNEDIKKLLILFSD